MAETWAYPKRANKSSIIYVTLNATVLMNELKFYQKGLFSLLNSGNYWSKRYAFFELQANISRYPL